MGLEKNDNDNNDVYNDKIGILQFIQYASFQKYYGNRD